MPKLKMQVDDGEVVDVPSSIRIIYEFEDDEVSPGVESEQLHMKFTTEGFVTDAVRNDEIADTKTMDAGEVFQAMIDSKKEW